jgi:hypothetical protein
MNFLQKLGLLILLSSLVQCTSNTAKKTEADSNYIPSIVSMHKELRASIKPFNDSIAYFGDTAAFFSRVQPILIGTDMSIGKQSELLPISRKDSLVYAASQRLNVNYQNLIHLGYLDLFEIYNKGSLSDSFKLKAESIMHYFMYEDSLAVNYFNSLTTDQSSRLEPLE